MIYPNDQVANCSDRGEVSKLVTKGCSEIDLFKVTSLKMFKCVYL